MAAYETSAELMNKPQIIEHARQSCTQTVYETRWVPCSARFVVLGSPPRGTGLIQVYSLSRGELTLLHEVRGARPPIPSTARRSRALRSTSSNLAPAPPRRAAPPHPLRRAARRRAGGEDVAAALWHVRRLDAGGAAARHGRLHRQAQHLVRATAGRGLRAEGPGRARTGRACARCPQLRGGPHQPHAPPPRWCVAQGHRAVGVSRLLGAGAFEYD